MDEIHSRREWASSASDAGGLSKSFLHGWLAPWRRHCTPPSSQPHAIGCLHYAGKVLGLL
jgi:hypothetical protein